MVVRAMAARILGQVCSWSIHDCGTETALRFGCRCRFIATVLQAHTQSTRLQMALDEHTGHIGPGLVHHSPCFAVEAILSLCCQGEL